MYQLHIYVYICIFDLSCIHKIVYSQFKDTFVHGACVFVCTSIYLTPDIAVSLVRMYDLCDCRSFKIHTPCALLTVFAI